MEAKRDLAIILRSVAFQERHRIVTALTENHGLVSAIARNAVNSRRFGGTLGNFSASEWHFTERAGAELWGLQEAESRRSFDGIQKDFERMALAGALSELMLRIAPHEPCPDLFKLHSNALAALDELPTGTRPPLSLLNAYVAKLLQWSGNQPQIESCKGCERSLSDVIRAQAGHHSHLTGLVADAGWICESCRQGQTLHIREREGQAFHASSLKLAPMALLDFYTSLAAPIRQAAASSHASPAEHKELFLFLEALLIYHLPGFDKAPIKSLRFLEIESRLSGA